MNQMNDVEVKQWVITEIFSELFGDLEFESFWDHNGHQFEGHVEKESVKEIWDDFQNQVQENFL